MIRIDDTLLQDLGLMSLPKPERDALLRQIYETLEMRVGMKLAERMSDQQLDEFERFIDGDLAFTENYLNTMRAGWQQSKEYQTALTSAQKAAQKRGVEFNENAVKTEFGALTWLETNFPDYKQVVASELETLKGEIKADSGKILEATQAQAGVPAPPQPQMQQQAAAPQAMPPQQSVPQQDNVVQADFQQPAPQPPVQDDQSQQPPAQAA
ncbi:hypothetical protein KC973_03505 [Candidatus Saccharibacteria bacterium]|nr:hypothetical protein [Candidatus Saccharibacteria bacterium]